MMRLRRASVIVALSLLASTATASAECAWVLWAVTGESGGPTGAFTTKPDCDRALSMTEQKSKGADRDKVTVGRSFDESQLIVGDKPVDYALFVPPPTLRLFIEAKPFGENLDNRRVAGAQWVVLTDGDEYRIYNAHAGVPVEDKLFRQLPREP